MSTTPSPTAPRPVPGAKKRRWAAYTLIGCLGASGLLFLLCCGGFLAAWRYRANEFHDLMANNAVVREHLGDLESCEMAWGEESADQGVDGVILLELRGSKGPAKANVTFLHDQEVVMGDKWGGPRTGIRGGELIMPDGTRYPLVPEATDSNQPKTSADDNADVESQTESESQDPFQDP